MPPQIDNQIEPENSLPPLDIKPKQGFPNWGKYILVCLVIFCSLALVVFGMFIFTPTGPIPQKFLDNMRNYRENQALNQSATTDQFADWKTYENTKYGFEIKIPNDLKDDARGNFVMFMSVAEEQKMQELRDICSESIKNNKIDKIACSSVDTVQPTFTFQVPNPGEDIQSEGVTWVKQKTDQGTSYGYAGEENGHIQIGNIKWEKFIDLDDFITFKYIDGSRGYSFYSKNETLLKQILSTFKFIK